jgi:hypothetical protein
MGRSENKRMTKDKVVAKKKEDEKEEDYRENER